MRRISGERGFTIVEMMVAVVVLLTAVLGTLAMLDTASLRGRAANDRQNGTALARQVVEAAKSVPYRDVAPGTIVSALREDSAIAGISDNPWRVERDNTTFTLQVDVCWLDEPADGLGSRDAGNFCPGSGTGGTADGNSIDHKRVTVVTSWRNSSGAGSSRQSTLVSARGGIDAPGVTSVRLTSPSTDPITDPLTRYATFAVSTNQDATAVVWSLDGAQQDTTSGSARDWTFSWELPAVDGAYDVSAQAFDKTGAGGEVRSVTVVVNRFVPRAPANMVAVRHPLEGTVEASWSASRERDVIGYRVYRQLKNGTVEVACDFVTDTTCVDTNPPPRSTTVLDYWVVAIDRDAQGQRREGDPSGRVDVNAPNSPPNAPVGLTVSADGAGNTVLQWNAPTVPDPDGDPIELYNIYRDGTAIADRYGQVPGADTTFVDQATRGVLHEYWVGAVDVRLTESSFAGPVSG